jgi:hypothetical protein
MNRYLSIALAGGLASVAHAVTFNNISFSFGGGFSGASSSVPSPYTGNSYTASLTNASLSGALPGTTTWEFNFLGSTPTQNISGFTVTIDGTMVANNQNAQGKVSLTSLDVLNTALKGSPNVFDLAQNGGGPESKSITSGNFAISFPLSGSDFNLTTAGGIHQGQFSLGDTYQVNGGGTVKITQIVITPQGTPEPSSIVLLGIPALGILVKKRRK